MSTTIVQDRYAETKEGFQALFEAYESQPNGQSHPALEQFRLQAMRQLHSLPFPTRRDEEWKYTSVNRILQVDYQEGTATPIAEAALAPYKMEGLDCHLLVFVNGLFQESLSDIGPLQKGVVIEGLSSAINSEAYGGIVKDKLSKILEGQQDPFKALNAALSHHALFIHLAPNTVLERPIYLLHLAAPGATSVLSNHMNIIVAGKGSEGSIIEGLFELPGSEGTYFNNLANYIELGANAHLHHYRLQQEGREGFLISNDEIGQHGDSTYANYSLDLGGRIVRNNLNTTLYNSGTTTNYYGVYFANGEQHIDNHTFIDHAVPHCVSNELYKGILTDRAQGVFNGKVLVRKDAQKTNAFQQNSSLVLSDKAAMDSKPELEIFADDVRCSHGATIGQLDESAVFYLRSRGLGDEEARAMLQHAFLSEALEFMKLPQVRQWAESMVLKKFGEKI